MVAACSFSDQPDKKTDDSKKWDCAQIFADNKALRVVTIASNLGYGSRDLLMGRVPLLEDSIGLLARFPDWRHVVFGLV